MTVAADRDGQRAIKHLEIDPIWYFDDLRIIATRAAAYAASGKFKSAVSLQQKPLKMAAKCQCCISIIAERLALYELRQAAVGAYY